MSRSIKANKNQKLKTKQIYEKRGKAAPSSKINEVGQAFFGHPAHNVQRPEE